MTQTETKPTPGPWVYVSSDGSIINPNGINDNKDSWHIAELTSKDGCLAANGYLIAEAGTVYHETGLSPRQLLAERSENMAKLAEAIKQRDIVMTALVHIRDNSVIANDIVESECHCGLYDTDLTLEEFCAKAIAAAKTSKEGV